MLIKESTLRRIIREEARRALREDDAAVPTPVAAPAPVPAPAKPPLTDPALIDTMIKSRLKASAGRFQSVVGGLKSEYGADGIEGRVEFTFDILTTGLVDRNTIKVKASPQTYQKEIETAFKNEVIRIRFDPIMSPVIGKAHAFSIPPGDV